MSRSIFLERCRLDLPGFTTAMDGGSAGAAGSGSSKNLEGLSIGLFDERNAWGRAHNYVIVYAGSQAPAWEPSEQSSSFARREAGASYTEFPSRSLGTSPTAVLTFNNFIEKTTS